MNFKNILTSKSNEYYTPPDIIEKVRQVLGTIDLDPASCPAANRIVRAEKYFDLAHDGLLQEWHGKVFVNPPGGLVTIKHREHPQNTPPTGSMAALWWRKLKYEFDSGRVPEAIFLAFNSSILHIEHRVLREDFLIPFQRIAFLQPDGDSDTLRVAKDPTHTNAIVYLGHSPEKFREVFSPMGTVIRGERAFP